MSKKEKKLPIRDFVAKIIESLRRGEGWEYHYIYAFVDGYHHSKCFIDIRHQYSKTVPVIKKVALYKQLEDSRVPDEIKLRKKEGQALDKILQDKRKARRADEKKKKENRLEELQNSILECKDL